MTAIAAQPKTVARITMLPEEEYSSSSANCLPATGLPIGIHAVQFISVADEKGIERARKAWIEAHLIWLTRISLWIRIRPDATITQGMVNVADRALVNRGFEGGG
jgi:hypothetical protein